MFSDEHEVAFAMKFLKFFQRSTLDSCSTVLVSDDQHQKTSFHQNLSLIALQTESVEIQSFITAYYKQHD